MSAITVGTDPIQAAPRNPRRHSLTVQLLPNNVEAGNTGLVFGKFGSAPYASLESNSWDFVLNAGALDGTNVYMASDTAVVSQELWLVSDAAGQRVNVVERQIPEAQASEPSGAAAA